MPGPQTANDEPASRLLDVEPRSSSIYMLRTVMQNHVHLSAMADQKANILIGASLVIFTIVLTKGLTVISPSLIILGASAIVAAMFAILAVKPRMAPPGQAAKDNVLFFGSFAHMDKDEYLDRMERVLSSDQAVYTAMSNDIYYIGRVLYHRKFRLLALSYWSFLLGLVLSVAAVVWENLP